MNINALITRRTNAYNRAVAKVDLIEIEVSKYERANGGFLSFELLDKINSARDAQSKTYASLVRAEKAA